MSVEALAWALSYAPDVPKHLVATLAAIANYADDRGRNAAPTHALLAWHTRKDERSVRRDVGQLETLKLIREGNQDVVLWLPPDRRPVVWDLAMERTRGPRPEPAPSGRPVDGTDRGDTDVPPVPPTGGTPTSPGSVTGGTPTSPRSDRGDVDVPPVDQGKRGVPPDRGDVDVPHKDLGGEERSSPPPNPLAALVALTPEEMDLHDEAMAIRPAWSPVALASVLADPAIRARPDRALVRLAVLDAAATRATFSPRRLLHDGCASWARAERLRFGDGDSGRTAEPAAVQPRIVPWCGDPGCDRTTRVLIDPATSAPLRGHHPCPDCHPYPDGRRK